MTHDAETLTTLHELASTEFQPWVPGMEAEMTPANLTEAANNGPFVYAYFAYKSMFQTKDAMVDRYRATPDAGFDLIENISGGAAWFEMIAGMMRAAAGRHMAALAVVELEDDLAEAA
ncbi:hypothetical protein WMC41_16260 [Shinella yambaruensis]|uniref:hypothetical protein n=1 Tax=Shinella yambaruensis TaxID=415996 RepID=UPI003D794FDF